MLRPIPRDQLYVGFQLPGAVRDLRGHVLLPAGKIISESDLEVIQKRASRGLYVGDDWDDPAARIDPAPPEAEQLASPDPAPQQKRPRPHDDLRPINISELQPGMRLEQDLYDAEGVLLLTAPNVINERFIRLLKQFGTTYVCVRDRGGRGTFSPRTAKLLSGAASEKFNETQLWETARELLNEHLEASNLVEDLSLTVMGGGSASVKPARDMVDNFSGYLARDPDLLIAVMALQRTLGEYLFDHAVNVAMISMSLAARVGLDDAIVQEIGLAGLFQDIGMLHIPDGLRLAPRALTPREMRTIRQHPLFTYRSLKSVSSLPTSVPGWILQVHERLDGSGYPRGLSGAQVSLPARVLGIADIYCAMTRPRPHRAPLMPHEALRSLLEAGHAGQLDRQLLRSFLDMQSAYGVGAIVELSDGRTMRVARANPRTHTRPVLAPLDQEPGDEALSVNLAKEESLQIVRVIVPGDLAG